jgi:hypothetical protein
MPYTKFQLRCIELGLCISCGDKAAGKYRRCLQCRNRVDWRKPRPKWNGRRRGLSYVRLEEIQGGVNVGPRNEQFQRTDD